MTAELAEGQKIQFKHKGRGVCGIIEKVDAKGMWVKLHTNYIGKNEEWFSGEDKHFWIKNCLNLKIVKK